MANIVEKVTLVKSDPEKNNNKFWRGTLYDNSDVLCEWGKIRDGKKASSKIFPGVGKSFLDKKIKQKKTEGRNGEIAYREADIVDDVASPVSVKPVVGRDLKTIAAKQIKTSGANKEVMDLIEYMTQVNIHNIASISGNKISYNYDKGMFQTPLGLVGQSTIDQARDTLTKIGDCVANKQYNDILMELTRTYLMSIPQDIGHKRLDLHEYWSDLSKVQQQNSVLDGLQASLVQATSSTPAKVNVPVEEQVFNVQLDPVKDGGIIKEVFDYYHQTKSTMHNCYHYRPIKMWKVIIANMDKAFQNDGAKMNLIVPGFHGTGSENLLSLLKSGFLVKPPSSAHLTSRVFGSGVYCAPLKRDNGMIIKGAATKALGYSVGFWGGSVSKRTFMFFVDMAMGKYYVPNSSNYQSISYPVKGYDSTWAFGGHSGVKNDEAIVYRSSQVNIKYLVEFEN